MYMYMYILHVDAYLCFVNLHIYVLHIVLKFGRNKKGGMRKDVLRISFSNNLNYLKCRKAE